MKKLLFTFLAFAATAINVSAKVGDTFTYTHGSFTETYQITSESPREVTLTLMTASAATDYNMPKTVTKGNTTYTVTAIYEYALEGAKFTWASISSAVTKIGKCAFRNCTALKKVYFDSGFSATSLPANMLKDCTSLQEFTVPASITSIDETCFNGCNALETVSFASGSKMTTLPKVFSSLSSLKEVSLIPASIETFSEGCFRNCSKLTKVTFEAGIKATELAGSMFANCSSLQSITIPANVTSIGKSCFSSCSALTSVLFANSGQNLTKIGDYAFAGCGALTYIMISKNVTSIGEAAFSQCEALNSVTFNTGNSALELSDYMFNKCTSLQQITLPSGITKIGKTCFGGCSALKKVVYSNEGANLEEIGDNAFQQTAMEEFTFPKNIVKVGNNTFKGNYNISKVIFLNPTPPTDGNNTTCSGMDDLERAKKLNIYVPYRSVNAYLASNIGTYYKSYMGVWAKPTTEYFSFCANKALAVHQVEGLTAYRATHDKGSKKIDLWKVTSDVQPAVGLIMKATPDKMYLISRNQGSAYPLKENILVGVTADTKINATDGGNTNFVLYNGEFHNTTAGTLASGKAYAQVPTSELPAGAKQLTFVLADDESEIGTTAIEHIDADNSASDQPAYNLSGQRVGPGYKGVVIINGKKMIRK